VPAALVSAGAVLLEPAGAAQPAISSITAALDALSDLLMV
jgi:hypothetical protein